MQLQINQSESMGNQPNKLKVALVTMMLICGILGWSTGTANYSGSKIGKIRQQLAALVVPSLSRDPAGVGVSANPNKPNWGAENAPFRRIASVSYKDGLNIPVTDRPNPRFVSNIVGAQVNSPVINNRLRLSILFTFTGQFLDHDLTLALPPLVAPPGGRQFMDITVPNGDKFFPNGSVIPFQRNNAAPSNGTTPRNQLNTLTAFIDLTQVYGPNNTVAQALRGPNGTLQGSTDPKDRNENLLPRFKQFTSGLGAAGERFRAGELRPNQNLNLLSIQTLFFREHNRIAQRFRQISPSLTNDQLYQAARNYNIAQWQKIVIYDWLPSLLGQQGWNQFIGAYTGPNPALNPTLPNEFSNVAFRIGHPLLMNRIPQIDAQGNIVGVFEIKELFEVSDLLNSIRMDNVFRGLMRTSAKEKGRQIIDDVRNFLFLDPHLDIIVDLFALNLQRAREHGLADYATMRYDLLGSTITSFNQITTNTDTVNRLRTAYGKTGAVDNVRRLDPWVGIITEDPQYADSVLGPVGVSIVGNTFKNIRGGDRLWFENVFPQGFLLDQIYENTMADIIIRNTNIDPREIQDDVFKLRTNRFY